MALARLAILSEEDYLAGEELPGPRHEYVRGEIFAMAGASKAHGTLTLNLATAIRAHLRGTPCRAWVADMKVRIAAAGAYYYPDLVATCSPADLAPEAPKNYLEAPKLVVEVLSPTTEKVDRREKWFAYRQLPSLEEYLLIDQERQWVEVFRRCDEGWLQEIAGPDETVPLASLGLTLTLAEIYEDSAVPARPAPDFPERPC